MKKNLDPKAAQGTLFGGMEAGSIETESRPLILSASRRCDLPGFYADACRDRIRRKIARLRTRYLYGVVFWTRHARPFLKGGALHELVLHELDNPVINLTVTGLGGSFLEPGVPSTREMLDTLPELVAAFHNEPYRIRWRFDPLLKGFSSIKTFLKIAEKAASLKIPTCTFSFPSYFSLKGDLTPQFNRAGIPRWERLEKIEFLKEMTNIATSLNIRLLSCAQPENLDINPHIEEAQCIPRDVLEQGRSDRRPLALKKDVSQRSKCRCIQSEDIGDYETDRCLGGCVYCYSKAGGPLVRHRH